MKVLRKIIRMITIMRDDNDHYYYYNNNINKEMT